MGIKEIYHSKFRWLGVALMILPLLSSCIREEEFNNSPQGNFEALWKIIDEQYCFLDYKQIDWDAIHDKYQPLITSNMGNDGLFQVLDSMLAELKDGHVNLYSSSNVARYWDWYLDYPRNFNEGIIERQYLGKTYRIAAGMKYKILDDNIGYIYYEAPANEQNFATLVEMLNAMEVREDDESFKNAVDLLFDALEQKDPDHFALRQYKKYKLAAGKTAKSILISCASRLAPFDIKEVREITMYDELDLDMLGDERTALFLIMSDTDGTFAFLISLIYSILFNRLCERADDIYGGRLPIHVRCLIDEAANIGQIPNLERLMATIRSREISACLVLQAQSQLKALYKDNMDTVIGNCDASLFLGGKEETTLKSWNSLLGKETIDLYNTSVTKGNQESHGQNFQKLGKDLMSVDELAVMDGGKCLLQIRGVRPFLSRKYDITKHPNYKLLSDFNEKNAFNIEKFLSTRMPMRPGERYRNYEVTAEDLASQTL